MHIRLLSWLFLCTSLAVVSRAQVAAPNDEITKPGTVLIAKVTGGVNVTANGAVTAAKVGEPVPQGAKIVTQQNSSVVLVYSNGATTQLGPDTEFILEEFLQVEFPSTIKVADLVEEPSPSRTKLRLNKGEIVGNVKKLKYGNGSSFTVQTPVGAAGIRGTTFRIVFRPTGSGQAFNVQGAQNFQFQLSTLEGDVGFAGGATVTGTTPVVGGQSVPTGQEIIITQPMTQNAQGQLVPSGPVTVTSSAPINANAAAAFAAVAQEVIATSANATFSPAGAGGAPGGGNQGQGGTGGGPTGTLGSLGDGNAPAQSFTNNANAPSTSPAATPPNPRLTPGG